MSRGDLGSGVPASAVFASMIGSFSKRRSKSTSSSTLQVQAQAQVHNVGTHCHDWLANTVDGSIINNQRVTSRVLNVLLHAVVSAALEEALARALDTCSRRADVTR